MPARCTEAPPRGNSTKLLHFEIFFPLSFVLRGDTFFGGRVRVLIVQGVRPVAGGEQRRGPAVSARCRLLLLTAHLEVSQILTHHPGDLVGTRPGGAERLA